jgi:hypothetical protein
VTRGVAATALTLAALTGCGVMQVETPDPAAVPDGPLEAHGAEATGPVVELGSGVSAGLGWRYAIYPSDDGWCTQLEMVDLAVAGCGDILPVGDDAFGNVGQGDPLANGVTPIEGIVTAETVTVWLLADDGRRAPATLMPLDEAGLDGGAFLAFVPPDVTLTHLLAVALNGEVLDTYELP